MKPLPSKTRRWLVHHCIYVKEGGFFFPVGTKYVLANLFTLYIYIKDK